MLQIGTGEKREPCSLLSHEFGSNQLTSQATATSAWWILPNVALARMHLASFIQTFLLSLPQYHTASSCQFPLPWRGVSHLQETTASQTVRKILEIQITVSQMRLRREGHTSLTRKPSMIWSETLVLPCPMLRFWHQAVELAGWKHASHRPEKASPNIFQLLWLPRWAVLLQQCGRPIWDYRYHL